MLYDIVTLDIFQKNIFFSLTKTMLPMILRISEGDTKN